MKNALDILYERGFIKQTVYEDDLRKLLDSESVPFYVGFDPTADSLHIGHYIPIMAMAHMQRAGHKPIALIGGGTAMIGDPSGRTDMRSMMTKETIAHNCEAFRKQMARFIRFEGENAAVMVNNGDWLLGLNYIDFLREFGPMFSVNKMLTADCYKQRLEKGLSFLEFNYMLMQAYDFYVLYKQRGVKLECGGNDQWSNILAGADLIRRKDGVDAYAMTFTLLETSDGRKMGKTAKGALWLDAEKTTPYEFYQYFRNVEDIKVAECMKLLTFMELDEIERLTQYRDERMNEAKKRLAYEVTKLVHGETEADKAQQEALSAFSGDAEHMPQAVVSAGVDTPVPDIMVLAGVAKTKSEARRLIEGGGVKLNETKVTDVNATPATLRVGNEFVLHKGKKIHIRVTLQ
ncbi:MAG: tyrosine--tRNA ligase [Clostridia bacterium]|jgi:tyrosyl-tRNA synthetase|nr:tyrosine--tRNA ligase [Clostridia bacterium]